MVTAAIKLKEAPWKKSYDKPRQYFKKQRYYFASKHLCSQIMVFLVVTYGCDIWTIKKAERQKIDASIHQCTVLVFFFLAYFRESGKIWENGIETCKISCMKRVASQV